MDKLHQSKRCKLYSTYICYLHLKVIILQIATAVWGPTCFWLTLFTEVLFIVVTFVPLWHWHRVPQYNWTIARLLLSLSLCKLFWNCARRCQVSVVCILSVLYFYRHRDYDWSICMTDLIVLYLDWLVFYISLIEVSQDLKLYGRIAKNSDELKLSKAC